MTHTEQYLHANSHPHPSHKLGVLNILATQDLRVCDVDNMENERNHYEEPIAITMRMQKYWSTKDILLIVGHFEGTTFFEQAQYKITLWCFQ